MLVGERRTTAPGFASTRRLVAGASEDEPARRRPRRDDDVFNIMYSSGTTGLPKGIVHTHYVRAMYCTLFASAFRITPESVVLHAGSIVFNGAMVDLMPWMFVGGTYILHESFDAERVIEDIDALEGHPHHHGAGADHRHPGRARPTRPEKLSSLEMLHNLGAPLHARASRSGSTPSCRAGSTSCTA